MEVPLTRTDPQCGWLERAQPPLDQRGIGQNPPVEGGVIDLQAALQEQLLDVPVAQGIAQVPGDAWRMSVASKCRPLKSSLDRRFSHSTRAFRILGPLRFGDAHATDMLNER
jgi:hypothetical protein